MGQHDEDLAPGESTAMTSSTSSSSTQQSTHNPSSANISISGSGSNCSSNTPSGTSSKLSSPTQEESPREPMTVNISCPDPDLDPDCQSSSSSSPSPNNSSSALFSPNTSTDISETESDKVMSPSENNTRLPHSHLEPTTQTEMKLEKASLPRTTRGMGEKVAVAIASSAEGAIRAENHNHPIKILPRDDEAVNMTKSREAVRTGNCSVGSVSYQEVGEEVGSGVNYYNSDMEGDNQQTVSSGSCSGGGGSSSSGGQVSKKKASFGFGFTKLNLRVFSRSSKSSDRLDVDVDEVANRMLMNNQLQSPPTTSSGPSVSKSSSESNIPMCHNSLDNLANDLPASRSTDSSCLLPCPGDTLGGEAVVASTSLGACDGGRAVIQSAGGSGSDVTHINKECVPSSSAGGASSSANANPTQTSSGCTAGPKFKLVTEGDVQVCKVKHGNNLMDKFIGSKLLRRWETHHIFLNDSCISSKTVSMNSVQFSLSFISESKSCGEMSKYVGNGPCHVYLCRTVSS